jgi:hypothetical protein
MTSRRILARLKTMADPEAVAATARYGIRPRHALGGASIPTLRKMAREMGWPQVSGLTRLRSSGCGGRESRNTDTEGMAVAGLILLRRSEADYAGREVRNTGGQASRSRSWIASDVLRELMSEKVRSRLSERGGPHWSRHLS